MVKNKLNVNIMIRLQFCLYFRNNKIKMRTCMMICLLSVLSDNNHENPTIIRSKTEFPRLVYDVVFP